jgi:hypothetical protein
MEWRGDLCFGQVMGVRVDDVDVEERQAMTGTRGGEGSF